MPNAYVRLVPNLTVSIKTYTQVYSVLGLTVHIMQAHGCNAVLYLHTKQFCTYFTYFLYNVSVLISLPTKFW